MPASIRLLSVLTALAFCLPVSATETAPAAAQPASAATAVPAPAAPATTTPVAPTAQAAKPAAAAPRVPPGYKTKVVDGETLYCRKSTPLGSRFPTEVCMTVAQYEDSVRQGDGLRQELTGKQKSYSINQ